MISEKELQHFMISIEKLSFLCIDNVEKTEEKLDSIIETAQTLQFKLGPLSQQIDQKQLAIKNMEECRGELLKTQKINRTVLEVENVIKTSPSGNLDNYLDAMDKIKLAIEHFRANDPANTELTNLDNILKVGNVAIEREFEMLLNQAFPILRPESIFSLCFTKESDTESVSSGHTVNTDIFDNVAEHHELELRKLSSWLLRDGLLNCIVKYCTVRRESLRATMDRFKDWCRTNPNLESGVFTMRTKNQNSKAPKRKTMSRKAGLIKENNHRRQVSDFKEEFEERDATLFSIQLVALVKLMKNERTWLEKLNLTPEYKDKCGAMDSIVKGCINDFLFDGNEIIKMMNQAQAKHQYHFVINLILIIERYLELKSELREILEILMNYTKQAFFNILERLTNCVYQCLDVYRSYVEIEKVSGSYGNYVPNDATVHELTTNTLRFLESLLNHGEVTEAILSNVSFADKIFPQKRDHGISYVRGASGSFTGDVKTKNPLFDYLSKVVEALISNMFTISNTYYNDDIGKVIFQMNNVHYIMKTLETPEFYGSYHSLSKGFKDVSKTLDERKIFYVAEFMRASSLPDKNYYSKFITSSTKVDSNYKVHIKDMWSKFNESFQHLVRQHRRYVVPDRELRKSLINELKVSFLPRFVEFRDKFLHINFTTKREKYITHNRDDIERAIDTFFAQ